MKSLFFFPGTFGGNVGSAWIPDGTQLLRHGSKSIDWQKELCRKQVPGLPVLSRRNKDESPGKPPWQLLLHRVASGWPCFRDSCGIWHGIVPGRVLGASQCVRHSFSLSFSRKEVARRRKKTFLGSIPLTSESKKEPYVWKRYFFPAMFLQPHFWPFGFLYRDPWENHMLVDARTWEPWEKGSLWWYALSPAVSSPRKKKKFCVLRTTNEWKEQHAGRERERESSTTFSMRKLTNISLFLALAFTGSFPLFLQESQRTETPHRVSATSEHFEIGFKVSFWALWQNSTSMMILAFSRFPCPIKNPMLSISDCFPRIFINRG